jgi:hypothetical protein
MTRKVTLLEPWHNSRAWLRNSAVYGLNNPGIFPFASDGAWKMDSAIPHRELQLKWTMALLISGKLMFAVLAGAFFGFTAATRDLWFLLPAAFFTVSSLAWAIVQSGLQRKARWSRNTAFVISFLQLPSLLFPLAVMSLRDLFKTSAQIKSSALPEAKKDPLAPHKPIGVAMAAVFALVMLSHILFGRTPEQLGKMPSHTHGSHLRRTKSTLKSQFEHETEKRPASPQDGVAQ